MKKIFPLTIVIVIIFSLFLCSCAKTFEGDLYVYEEENLEITFPKDMKVFDLLNLDENDADLEKYQLDYQELKDLSDTSKGGGIVYFAESHDMKRDCSFSITASEATMEVWDFTDVNSSQVTAFAENEANILTTDFYVIKDQKEYRQKNLFFIRFDMSSTGGSSVDTIYLFTVKNGLKYCCVYYSDQLSKENIEQAENIFDSIRVTKDIPKYTEKNTNNLIPVALIVGFIVVVVVALLCISSIRKQNRRERENGAYTKQFKSVLEEDDLPKKRNKK